MNLYCFVFVFSVLVRKICSVSYTAYYLPNSILVQFTITVLFLIVCLQVYNEQIRDLLTNAGPLAVREDGSKGVVVQGLTLHQVSRKMCHTHYPVAS